LLKNKDETKINHFIKRSIEKMAKKDDETQSTSYKTLSSL
jgi:hypothetical protein